MIQTYRNHTPRIDATCFVADNATIIGDVTMKADASVWFGSVIRGDKDHIEIGEGSNIQDNCTLHTDPQHVLTIGKHVTVGHNAILHGCHIEDEVLIGMGAIILNGAHIGSHSIIVAGYNKIVEDEEAAKKRIREIAAPANSVRLHKQTPCSKTGSCQDCYSKDRICSSYVKINYDKEDRIRVILIAEAYGY